MKILFITHLYPSQPHPPSEPVTTALHDIVKHWAASEDVLVVRPEFIYFRELLKGRPLRWYREFMLDGVRVLVVPVLKIPRVAYWHAPVHRYLGRYLQNAGFDPDIVIAHYEKSLDLGRECAQKLGRPLIAGLHTLPDMFAEDSSAFRSRCGLVIQTARAVACRSKVIQQRCEELFPEHRSKFFEAFSGIEEELILDPGEGIGRIARMKTDRRVSLVTVSMLIARKHLDANLRAFATLPGDLDWTYTIVGEGEERAAIVQLAEELGVGNRVVVTGQLPRTNAMDQLRRGHIFVLVSSIETFGLAYLEAMAAGNIVVGSRNEGIDGVIVDGVNGYLSPAGDEHSLARLVRRIALETPEEELTELLKQSHSTVCAYTDRKAARHYLKNVESVLNF